MLGGIFPLNVAALGGAPGDLGNLRYQASTLLSGLEFGYLFDEGGGTRFDVVGTNHLATTTALAVETGLHGLAASFAGSGELKNTTPDEHMQAGSGSVTFAVKCLLLQKGAARTIFSKWELTEYEAGYLNTSDRIRFFANDKNNATQTVVANNLGSPNLDVWYTIFFGYDHATGKLFVQVGADGTPDTVDFLGPIKSSTGDFYVGARSATGANDWYGKVDCLFGWKRILTAEEKQEFETYDYPWGTNTPGPGIATPGAWCWFSNPRAVYYNGKTFIGSMSKTGDVQVSTYNHATGAMSAPVVLAATFEVDDHDHPALLVRESDKRLMAFYTKHGGNNYYMQISANPGDASAWDAAVDLNTTLAIPPYTYAYPIQLLDEANDPIYVFFRSRVVSGAGEYVTTSEDGGATWSAPVRIFGSNTPYSHFCKNGEDRIDWVFVNQHPDDGASSVYHAYYTAGKWYSSSGVEIASLPATTAAATLVYDGSSVRSWNHDIAIDVSGNPVIVYATFPTPASDHRYNYARWTGATWESHEICAAGGPLYAAETYYSGGICLDHNDVSTVYCSREVDGVFELWKYTTADNGTTWTGTKLTSQYMRAKSLRPCVVYGNAGDPKLIYENGLYNSYADYDTSLILRNG